MTSSTTYIKYLIIWAFSSNLSLHAVLPTKIQELAKRPFFQTILYIKGNRNVASVFWVAMELSSSIFLIAMNQIRMIIFELATHALYFIFIMTYCLLTINKTKNHIYK